MEQGLVFDIKRYAINDGPGIRVSIFFKGCPLNCRWCHNPESISPQIEKLFSAERCIGCGECVRVCPVQACRLTPQGVVTDLDLCTLCGQCAEVCPTRASEMSGRVCSIDELLEVIERERPFFERSGGGVTFSGGEPLLQSPFLIALLDACGRRGVHRAVDTSGYVRSAALLEVAQHADLFLYDLKLADGERHRRLTGVDNRLILDNLAALAASGAAIRVRLPLVCGVNDDDANIEATAAIVAALPGEPKPVDLLPYHAAARGKDQKLGRSRDLDGMREPSAADLKRVAGIFAAHGLVASVGG